LKVKYSISIGFMLCGLVFGQEAPQSVEQQSVELPAAEQQQADTLVMDSELDAETELAEPETPDDLSPQYYVAQTDSATGEQVYVPLDKYAQPYQTVYVVQEEEPGSGEYFYIALSEQPVSVRMPLPAPPEQPEPLESPELSEEETPESLEPTAEPVEAVLLPSDEETALQKTMKNYIIFDPIFLITNVGLGIALGTDGFKNSLNERLEMEMRDLYIVSEMVLNAKGKAKVTDIKSSGFGFALQYERQLLSKYGLMGRFSYAGLGLKMDFEDTFFDIDYSQNISGACTQAGFGCEEAVEKFSTDMGFYNWNLEIHNRYYPRGGGALFLDGVIGFGGAGLSTKRNNVIAAGDYVIKTPGNTYKVESGSKTIETLNVTAKRGYMLLGPMFGWREVFDKKKGGFIWETSIGYLFGIGFNESIADQFADGNLSVPHTLGEHYQDVDDVSRGVIKLVENLMIVGGPRFRITFGWAF